MHHPAAHDDVSPQYAAVRCVVSLASSVVESHVCFFLLATQWIYNTQWGNISYIFRIYYTEHKTFCIGSKMSVRRRPKIFRSVLHRVKQDRQRDSEDFRRRNEKKDEEEKEERKGGKGGS